MGRHIPVQLYDIVAGLSHAMDLINPRVVDHHKRVAYIASGIAEEMGMGEEDIATILLASLMHDAGSISLRNRLDIMNYDMNTPHAHADLGFHLLNFYPPFAMLAKIVRHHHVPWEKGRGTEFRGEPVHRWSHLIHLADRIDVLIDRVEPILGQVRGICGKIRKDRVKKFMPDQVDAFLNLAGRESFWLDAVSPELGTLLAQRMAKSTRVPVDLQELEGIAALFGRIIDFRSCFTSLHSAGVTAVAGFLAGTSGLSENTRRRIVVAGRLHDLGKLAVSKEILEKPARLSTRDRSIINIHTYHTYRILERIGGFEKISTWAAFHHERADGSGYPFHVKGRELSHCCRIMAVADVFTAITEDRPYRKGMSAGNALRVLTTMARAGKLDASLVALVKKNWTELCAVRSAAQGHTLCEYESFAQHLG